MHNHKIRLLFLFALTLMIITLTFANAVEAQIQWGSAHNSLYNSAKSLRSIEIEPVASLPSSTPISTPDQSKLLLASKENSFFNGENIVNVCMAIVALTLVVIVAILLSIEKYIPNSKN